jgi:ABC-2 type transport system permease protein
VTPVLAIAHRDVVKFLRDRPRLITTFIFPVLIIGVLGSSAQSNLGRSLPFDLKVFTFVGVLGLTLFQSSALGIVSLLEDRDNDFTQEIFVAPVSRYAIIFGKILGESAVSLVQAVGILFFGVLVGVPLGWVTVLALVPLLLAACLVGGAFGILVLSVMQSRRSADQIFPFLMLPQFFLAGVFVPVKVLPFYLDLASRISPLRYVVDLLRGVYYRGKADYGEVVLQPASVNLVILAAIFVACLVIGTRRFVQGERNR